MNHFPLLPVFVAGTMVMVVVIVAMAAIGSWWALGGAVALHLTTTGVVANELRHQLEN
jgi:hypothetical protein